MHVILSQILEKRNNEVYPKFCERTIFELHANGRGVDLQRVVPPTQLGEKEQLRCVDLLCVADLLVCFQ